MNKDNTGRKMSLRHPTYNDSCPTPRERPAAWADNDDSRGHGRRPVDVVAATSFTCGASCTVATPVLRDVRHIRNSLFPGIDGDDGGGGDGGGDGTGGLIVKDLARSLEGCRAPVAGDGEMQADAQQPQQQQQQHERNRQQQATSAVPAPAPPAPAGPGWPSPAPTADLIRQDPTSARRINVEGPEVTSGSTSGVARVLLGSGGAADGLRHRHCHCSGSSGRLRSPCGCGCCGGPPGRSPLEEVALELLSAGANSGDGGDGEASAGPCSISGSSGGGSGGGGGGEGEGERQAVDGWAWRLSPSVLPPCAEAEMAAWAVRHLRRRRRCSSGYGGSNAMVAATAAAAAATAAAAAAMEASAAAAQAAAVAAAAAEAAQQAAKAAAAAAAEWEEADWAPPVDHLGFVLRWPSASAQRQPPARQQTDGDDTARGVDDDVTKAGRRRCNGDDASRTFRRACQAGYMPTTRPYLPTDFLREWWAATAAAAPDGDVATSDSSLELSTAARGGGATAGCNDPWDGLHPDVGPESFDEGVVSYETVLSRPSLLAAGLSSLLETLSAAAAAAGRPAAAMEVREKQPAAAAAAAAATAVRPTRGSRRWAAAARRRIRGLGRRLSGCFLLVAPRD
ncbi:hypothetical protein PLESTM_000309900 [Pleodorina starrii]|nr:hypothetical protein PLESTM_000309900 [Pleodorina starrii]